MPTGEAMYTMPGHTAAVNAVAVTGDGCKTISGSFDTTIKFWNTDISSRYVCMTVDIVLPYITLLYNYSTCYIIQLMWTADLHSQGDQQPSVCSVFSPKPQPGSGMQEWQCLRHQHCVSLHY